MSFHIYSVETLPGDAWSALTGNSFFSSPSPAPLWKRLGGETVFMALEERGRLRGGMAGVLWGGKYLHRFQSMPESLYGGIFWDNSATESEKGQFPAELENFLKEGKYIRADIYNPPSPFKCRSFMERETTTHLLQLPDGPYEIPNRRMGRYIRHAHHAGGYQITVLDDEKYLDGFCRLVADTDRRHKRRSRYSREFFEQLLEISRKDKRIIWPLVLTGEKVSASHIYFIERSQIFDWQSYSDREDPLRPNYLLYDYIIAKARELNIREINLGGSPPGVDTLPVFKENWGARPLKLKYYTYLAGLGKLIYRGKRL